MDKIKASKDIDYRRRHFVGTAALTVAAAQLGMIGVVDAQSGKATLPSVKPGSHTSFGALKQIDAGLLNVGYAEAGPADGPPVLLLRGWPYDIYSFVDVTPLLASAGYRVIVPYLRGYGTTRFLSSETFRNAIAIFASLAAVFGAYAAIVKWVLHLELLRLESGLL